MKEFSDLTITEKIKAVLACVAEPVTRYRCLELCGLNEVSDSLGLNEIEQALSSIEVDNTAGLYILKIQFIIQLEQQVDFVSVHKQIADVLMDQWTNMEENFLD